MADLFGSLHGKRQTLLDFIDFSCTSSLPDPNHFRCWRSEFECPQNAMFRKLLNFARFQKLDMRLAIIFFNKIGFQSSFLYIITINLPFTATQSAVFRNTKCKSISACTQNWTRMLRTSIRIVYARTHTQIFFNFIVFPFEHSLAPPATKMSASKFTRCERNLICCRWPRTTRDMTVAFAAAV